MTSDVCKIRVFCSALLLAALIGAAGSCTKHTQQSQSTSESYPTAMTLIEPGQRAPSFTLADQNGKKHALKDYAGQVVVLYFYPKDDTPGCTIQACGFRDALPRFDKIDAVVLGVSPDDPQSHAAFVKKFDLNFTLLADVPAAGGDGTPPVCSKYGVWQERQMAGNKYMGVARTTYLIGPDGNVVRRWDKVKVEQHADEVLAAIAELQSRV